MQHTRQIKRINWPDLPDRVLLLQVFITFLLQVIIAFFIIAKVLLLKLTEYRVGILSRYKIHRKEGLKNGLLVQ